MDPVWAVSYDNFVVCQRVLQRQPLLLSIFREIWELRNKGRCHLVGPVGNLFHAAKQLGLAWPSFDTLQACIWDRRDICFLNESSAAFAHELRDCARQLLWSRAGQRRADLQGLETGVETESTCQLLRASKKSQIHKGMLRSILAGGVVSGKRAQKAGFSSSEACEFCTCHAAESVHHLFWECPAWAHVRAKHSLATGSWRADWPACFSCCGVLSDGVIIPTPQEDAKYLASESEGKPLVLHLDEVLHDGMVEVYTDGACLHNQVATLRKAGYGAWWADGHPANISMALPGHVQTNNRAELAAVLHVLQVEPRKLLIKTDSDYVLKGCLYHRHVWATAGWAGLMNADLWRQVHSHLESRNTVVVFSKVKGLLLQKMWQEGLSQQETNTEMMLLMLLLERGRGPMLLLTSVCDM